MMVTLFLQLALAATGSFASVNGDATNATVTPVPVHAAATPTPIRVVAGPDDRTALDILNNTRPDILRTGATKGCPVVTALYVDGVRREAPADVEGFSALTVYVIGDSVTVMLPRAVADALRTVEAADVDDITYVDCAAATTATVARNALYITTK